jgi:hypothetical protein
MAIGIRFPLNSLTTSIGPITDFFGFDPGVVRREFPADVFFSKAKLFGSIGPTTMLILGVL